jgi:hypothetical protein
MKGQKWFERTKESIIWKETKIEDSIQKAFIRPEIRPETREKFWHDFATKDFSYIAKKYGGQPTLMERVCQKIRRAVKKLIRRGNNNESG